MNQMTPKQALEAVNQIVINYKGTLQEHQILQTAMKVLSDLVEPKDKSKE